MLVFEAALGPLENALDSLGRFQCRAGAEAGPQYVELGIGLGAQHVPDWSMLSSGELSEPFDVLGPWCRAACWLLHDRALTMSTTGSSGCAAPSMDLAACVSAREKVRDTTPQPR
jgi:hypothetical protein